MLCQHGNMLPCFQCDVEPLELKNKELRRHLEQVQIQAGNVQDDYEVLTLKLLEKEEEVRRHQARVAELEAQASARDWMPTLEWGVKRCEALTEQGFDRIRIDMLQRNFVNAIDAHRPGE
jgi:chromosome segregation ATPase